MFTQLLCVLTCCPQRPASLYVQVLNPQANEVLYRGTVALVRWIMAVRNEENHIDGTNSLKARTQPGVLSGLTRWT